MTGRAVFGWGMVDGLGVAAGRNVRGRRGAQWRAEGARPARQSPRHRRLGADAARGQAAPNVRPASRRRRASPRSRDAAAGLRELRRAVPHQGLAVSPGRDLVRRGGGTAAPVPLSGLRSRRDGDELARARPLDPRAGSAASIPVRAHDVPRRRRRAGPLAASRGRNEPRDPASSYARARRATARCRHGRAGRRGGGRSAHDRPQLGCDVHPELPRGRTAPGGARRQVERPGGSRQLFGAVANAGTDIVALIQRTLDTMGRTSDTEPTAFTDGCSSMRSILAEAGVTDPPILDWFHLSMRLQHAKQAAGGLPADGPDRVQARAAIAAEVERLRWRTWNGKAKDAWITLERIHALLPAFEGEPARKLRRALDAVDRYLRSQSAHLVDYAERHRAGLRVGTSLTEGTANFLVNRRMAKAQQMRWPRRGADLLLQVRCAVYNGTLGTGFGQRFQAANDPHPPAAIAA